MCLEVELRTVCRGNRHTPENQGVVLIREWHNCLKLYFFSAEKGNGC